MENLNREMNSYNENGQALIPKTSFAEQMAKVYGWMFVGLAMTAGIAIFTANSSLRFLALDRFTYLILAVIELGFVWYLSSKVFEMKYENAAAMFVIYSGLNGLTFSIIFFRYNLGSIATVFFITSALFGFMSVYGLVTKQDLTKWGQMFIVGLFGIIIATLANIFMKSDTLSMIISYIGVAVFLGLTAYDSKKLKEIYTYYAGTQKENNVAIIGALTLYLDFINLFLFILRILGRKK
mgnify:CR=1 FL=1